MKDYAWYTCRSCKKKFVKEFTPLEDIPDRAKCECNHWAYLFKVLESY